MKTSLGSKHTMHEEHKYIEYHSVCPLVGIWTPPPPFPPQASVPLPLPEPTGGGGHTRLRAAGEGVGESLFRRLEKSLELCLLFGTMYRFINMLLFITWLLVCLFA